MSPYWFVFDMDETLTHVSPYRALLCTFFVDEFAVAIGKEGKGIANELRIPLLNAYIHFFNTCVSQEKSDTPLGLLRPGIREIFTKIGELKDSGIAGGCIIYSNNRTRRILQYIRDLIHAVVGRDDLILDIAHASDARRNEGKQKTVATISKLLREGPYKVPDVKIDDIFFFDDIEHIDIKEKLANRYIQVYPYEYRVNTERIVDIYMHSLQVAGILTDEKLIKLFLQHIMNSCSLEDITEGDTSEILKERLIKSIQRQISFWNQSFGPYPWEPSREINNSIKPVLARLGTLKGGKRASKKKNYDTKHRDTRKRFNDSRHRNK